MGIRFLCPNGHKLNVKAFLAGQRGICPHCGERFLIPSESIKNIRVDSLGGPRSAGDGTAIVEEDSELADFAMQSHLVPTVSRPEVPVAVAAQPEAEDAEAAAISATAPGLTPTSQTAPAAVPRPFDQPTGVGGIALEIGEDFAIVPPPSQANTPSAPLEDDLLAAGSRFEDLPDLEELAAAARDAGPSTVPTAAPITARPSVGESTRSAPSGTPPATRTPSTAAEPAQRPARPSTEQALPTIPPPTPPASLPGVDPISEMPHAVWYVRLASGEQFGPAPGDAMRRWLDEGRVPPGCLVWREGWPDWRRSEATFAVVAQRVPPAIPGAMPATPAPASARPPSPTSSLGMGATGSFASSPTTALDVPSAIEPVSQPLPPASILAAKRRRAQRIMALIVGLLALSIVGLVPVLIYVLLRQ